MTKAEILAWHERAKRRVELRAARKLPGWEPLSADDVAAYERIIETTFQRLREEHNAEVRRRRGGQEK